MRLDTEFLTPKPLPASLVQALAHLSIYTTSDLLFNASTVKLITGQTPLQARAFSLYEHLPSGIISLRDLERCLVSVLRKIAPPGVSAHDLHLRSKTYLNAFPTLDRLIDSEECRGLPSQNVYEISGDRGAGKSTLALNIVLRNLFFGSSEILWIDSTGDFSADRALEVLHTISEEPHPSKPSMDLDSDSDSNPFEPSPPSIENALEDALTRLRVSVAFDIQTAYEIFDSLGLSTNSATMFTPIRCIVIDPITPLLSPHLSAASAQGHALMTAFMRHLKALANRFNLVVFVVNNATLLDIKKPVTQNQVNSTNLPSQSRSILPFTDKKPALGPSFAYMTDATFWVAEWRNASQNTLSEEGTTLHVLEILRSRISPSNTWCKFKIRGCVVESMTGAL
ncbi:hypothetical protein VKT23_013113 [Stygiomarasmius scandens]|uniref:RecA family profile 1 domain-containing protein n=1 Tax=Marasmiellus scandens TaxID=2682957 RepID=A0ABR1J8H2_9AGAR